MCNQSIQQRSNRFSSQTPMDSPVQSPDETQRVKFLCSFGGSIMPRPQDGKLRYVGGETRIVSVPRDVNYEELMARMRELFEGAIVLKYQQPDEDLDALVSVVNDDDVTNMMEEYDKLGSGDGFTRLRMFLFPHPDHDSTSSPHFDSDERESERRYVDALNSLNDASEFRLQQGPDSPVIEPLMNPMTMEFGRNCEIPLPQFNLRHLTIPHLGSSVQHQQPHTQRYSEMEAPWSPAYYSPRHHGHHDSRPVTEFPSSPSSARYRMQLGEFPDRMAEEYGRQQPMTHQPQSPFADNVVWLPAGAVPGDNSGFPVNLGHPPGVFEGNNICEHCRMSFQRNPASVDHTRYHDPRWTPGAQSHVDAGCEFHQFANPCVECNSSREAYAFNPDTNLEHGVYSKEQNDPRNFYNETHIHERGWGMHSHHLNHRGEEVRMPMSGAGWINEQHVVEGTSVNGPLAQGNCIQQVSSNCINHADPRCNHTGPELGEHAVGVGPHIQVPAVDDRGMRYGNFPPAYGTDNSYQVSHGPAPSHALWLKMQNPLHASPSYEALNMLPQVNGTVNSGFPRQMREDSPSFRVGLDNPNPWVGQSQKTYGVNGSSGPECPHGCAPKFISNMPGQENQNPFAPDPVRSPHDMIYFEETVHKASSLSSTSGYNPAFTDVTNAPGAVILEEKSMPTEGIGPKLVQTAEGSDSQNESYSDKNGVIVNKCEESSPVSTGLRPVKENGDIMEVTDIDGPDTFEQEGLSVKRLSFLPELIASVKKAALESAEEVKGRAQGNVENDVDSAPKEAAFHELEAEHTDPDVDDEFGGEHKIFGIEQTKAEAEALNKGLQTIRNDDLEEIRELGSGTYGAVYHGKWKGSDVAIKRIKASCFAGRPSERERLIADFWKEALILSSLHHPNVVSFYGIVRDGPDGSLATVTEFMINGSLKQFLQKKDRTIDRRKRLLIAMDSAFGMEYLHGKNIVHFDLKCENLLVNMRDPHRPICKIGDLGLSKVKQHTLVSGGVRGTLPWMAPELLSGKSNMVSEKIDVYSFGIVMWELLTGEEPYADMHCASIIGGIVNNSLRPQIPSWCDPEWRCLMETCWGSDPGERPSFSEISQKLRKMAAGINLK